MIDLFVIPKIEHPKPSFVHRVFEALTDEERLARNKQNTAAYWKEYRAKNLERIREANRESKRKQRAKCP